MRLRSSPECRHCCHDGRPGPTIQRETPPTMTAMTATGGPWGVRGGNTPAEAIENEGASHE